MHIGVLSAETWGVPFWSNNISKLGECPILGNGARGFIFISQFYECFHILNMLIRLLACNILLYSELPNFNEPLLSRIGISQRLFLST